jgi:hypothetical protein
MNHSLNNQIVTGFINGQSIEQLASENNLDETYITLVLYQEGIHYTFKEIVSKTLHNLKGSSMA